MNPIKHILSHFSAMVLDGAFATELEKRGCNLNDPLWSAKILMEQPEMIGAVHTDYFEAGADCVITASYQASYEGFEARGLTPTQAADLIRLSVTLAKEARDGFWERVEDKESRPHPLVAASVGPYGAFLADGSEYRGDYDLDEDQLMDFHRRRLQTLITAGPDLLACETLPCFAEARALTRLITDHPDTWAWISFTAKDGEHLRNGEKIYECARWLDDFEQIVAVGVNCTEPEHLPSLIRQINQGTSKPVIVYPNSGERYDPVGKCWINGGTADFANQARTWFDAGARIIGGCCRTGPSDIKGISAWVR